MKPDRFREILTDLGESNRWLAQALRRSHRTVDHWASGREPIPEDVAAWLEQWCAIRRARGQPRP